MNRERQFIEFIRSKINAGSAAELGWVFFGQLINVLLGFVILKILSKMGTEDYGIYALIITISSLLTLTFYGPLLQGFVRFYYDYLERNAINIYLGFVYKTIYITGFVHFTASIILTFTAVFWDLTLSPLLVLFAGIYILGIRTGEFFSAFLSIIRKRKENSLIQGGERLITAGLLFVLLYFGNLNLFYVFMVFTIISFLFVFIKIKIFNRFVPEQAETVSEKLPCVKSEIRRKILTYILPFLIWGLTAWLQLNGEKWVIAGLLSTADVGIYAVMISLITALIVFPSSVLTEFATPMIFQNFTDIHNSQKIRAGHSYIVMNTIFVLIVTILGTVITALFGQEMIIIISMEEYSIYAYLLPYLCFGIGLFYTGQALSTLGMALNQPRKYILPKIVTGLLSILLNFILIENYGMPGTAYTAVIIGVIYSMYILLINRSINRSINVKQIE